MSLKPITPAPASWVPNGQWLGLEGGDIRHFFESAELARAIGPAKAVCGVWVRKRFPTGNARACANCERTIARWRRLGGF